MKKIALLALSALAAVELFSKTATMAGLADMREAAVWADFGNAEILKGAKAVCFSSKTPESKIDGKIVSAGDALRAGVAKIIFDGLLPNTAYDYVVSDSESVIKGSFKTKPDYVGRTPPPDFSFVAAGSNYFNDAAFDPPFRTPGGEYEIYSAIKNARPDFILWAGPFNEFRSADVSSRSGVLCRLLDARKVSEISQLLNAQPNYGVPAAGMVADSSSAGAPFVRESFKLLWANPEGTDASSSAYSFSYADADFFVLDDFSNRLNLDYRDDRPRMLGDAQLRWLFASLRNSKATFKFIVMNTPIANPVESSDNFTKATVERKALFDFLFDKKIGGVVMICAKKDYAELTRFVRAGCYPILEITAGPLTARPAKEAAEMNYFRVPGSTVAARSFSQIKVEGAEGSRSATVTFYDSKGRAVFSSTVKETDLRKFD